jgi:hypothetical protein
MNAARRFNGRAKRQHQSSQIRSPHSFSNLFFVAFAPTNGDVIKLARRMLEEISLIYALQAN